MLEEKLDVLTKEIVALRKVIEASGLGGAAASTSKPAADKPETKTRTTKPKAVEPTHDADEVGAILRKVSTDISKPAAREIISGLGAKDLADLLTKPELFDKAFEQAEAALGETGDDDESSDDEI